MEEVEFYVHKLTRTLRSRRQWRNNRIFFGAAVNRMDAMSENKNQKPYFFKYTCHIHRVSKELRKIVLSQLRQISTNVLIIFVRKIAESFFETRCILKNIQA